MGWEEGSPEKVALHAAVGGAVAAIAGGNIAAGAGAAALNEALLPYLIEALDGVDLTGINKDAILVLTSQAIGGLVSGANGAAITGKATKDNYLTHKEALEREIARKKCAGGDGAACQRARTLNELDQERDRQLIAACGSGGSPGCRARVTELHQALASFHIDPQSQYDTPEAYLAALGDAFSSLSEEYAQNNDLLKALIADPEIKTLVSTLHWKLYAENTSAFLRFVGGMANAGGDTIRGLHSLAATLAHNPEQLAQVVEAIIDDPSLIPRAMLAPFKERIDAGDYAGAAGYAIIGLVELFVGSKGTVAAGKGTITTAKGLIKALASLKRGRKLSKANFPEIERTVSRQKQNRHITGAKEHQGGGVFDSQADAQKVLDAYHSGKATVIGKNRHGNPVVRFSEVTGTDINKRHKITNRPTNVFVIKGEKNPSVVPISPKWKQK